MRHLRCALITFALSLTTCALAQENSPAPSTPASTASSPSPFEQLSDATRLDRKDAQPFHLKIDVQLFEMKGKSSETGTIEEWWVSPNEYRIEFNSGSLQHVIATGQTNEPTPANRDSYLMTELWLKIVRPLQYLPLAGAPKQSKQMVGTAQLDCFTLPPSAAIRLDPSQDPVMYCTDPEQHSLRLVRTGDQLLVRNSLGKFHGTEVALSSTLLYLDLPAISAKISALQSFTPGSPGSPALQPNPPAAAAELKTITSPAGAAVKLTLLGRVAGGRALDKPNPVYPPAARAVHIHGRVLLHAVITKSGRISSLFVIASPHELLSEAAMDAVRNWKYEPYLLNGQPVERDTTIAVNFFERP